MTTLYCVECDMESDAQTMADFARDYPDEIGCCPHCGSQEPLIDADNA